MADRILSSGASVARALGVRPPQRQTLTTGLADLEVKKQAALDRIAGLGAASAPRLRPPPGSALQAGPDIYYSPSTDRYAAGGMEFGATEYDVALRAMENLQAPTRSPGGDFQRIPVSTLEAYRKSISEGRGLMGNLAVGAQNVGEGIVGGIGRGLQMLGAEGTGQAFVDVGEAIGMSPAEQARSAAIAQEQGLAGQIGTAAVQSAPTLGVAIGAGLAGAAVGGPVGAIAGVALSILPMELQASWEAAEQGGLDTSDPEIQTEILASTLFKTGVQTFGTAYLARGLSPAFRTMLGDVSKRTMGARITRGIGAGALEGSAEAIAQATDRVAFDPELRASMTEGDWAAIAPAFVNKYGTEALVAFGAGFLLGAPLGAIASPEAAPQTPPSPRRDVDSGQQIDALSGATLEPQALPTPAPVAGLLPPPPAALPAPPAGLLPAPPAALPAPDRSAAAAPDIIVPPAPAGSVAPPVVPAPAAPAAPVAPAPITAPDLGLEGPVAEGFNIASLRQGPPAPPPRVAPQVFSAGPAESTVQSPFVEPMNALRQQQVARMERLAAEGVAQKRAKEARLEAEQRGAAAWDALVEEQGGVDFIALPARAQEAWINAVAANVGPRGQTLQQYFDALVGAAGRAGRRQQAEATPEPTTPSIPGAPPTGSRATRTTPQEEAALAGVQVGSVDEAIANGIGTITVTENGQPVPFKNFALSVDGDRAEVGMVERERGKTRAGIGRDAYVALGDALAARGITLQSSELLQAPGKRLWERLVLEGKARRNPQTKRFEYIARTPTAPKSDVVSETTVGRDGLTLVHGGRPGLTIDTVNIIRPAGQMKQGKKGRRYGGFYATTEADAAQAEGYAGADGEVYDVRVRPGTRIAQRAGDITRLSEAVINQYVADGYGVVYGKDPRGRTEYVVINKAAIESIAPRTPPTPPTGGKTTRTPPQEGAAKARARQQAAAAKITKGARQAQDMKVLQRQMALSPGQKAALLTELDTDLDGLIDMMFGDPARVDAAIDRILEEGRDKEAQGQEAAGARQTQAQPQKVGGLSQAEREAAQQANKAADLLIGRDREAPARRTQEQIAAEQARVEAARAEAATRTETVAAAERAAIQEPQLPAPTPATELSAAAQAWADAQAEREGEIEIDYDELPDAERARWDGEVRRGTATPRKAVNMAARAAGKADDRVSDAELDLETIADAEQELLGARAKPLTADAIDAAVELFTLRDIKTTSPENRTLIDRALEQNLTRTQYAEAERIYQQRNQIARLNGEEGPVSPETRAAQAGAELLDLVNTFNMQGEPMTRALQERFAALVRDIRKVPRKNTSQLQPVDYAKTDGMPNIVKGKIRPIRGFETDGATSLRGYNTLEGAADMNGKPVGPMPTGKLRMAAQAFLSRLAEKPNTFYFKDQADLRARNPELYARAEAARPQGDFAEVDAAAYFFGGDNVIVFTDRIANTGHLNTVMAHEIMGHYGIRAIVGNANFRKVMDAVYKNSTDQARILIDQAVEARGLSRAEATEEYLSDYAARIETNILQRWWNAVKGALNKLGVRFGDEHARYLLAQARRYTTLGQQSSAFDAEVMGLRMNTLESGVEPSGDGRFARANESVAASAINAARLVETAGIPRPKNLDDALARVQDFAKRNVGMNVADFYDTLKSQTFTPTLWRSIRNQGFNRVWLLIRERYDIARTHINRMQELRSKVLRPAVEVAGRTLSGGLTMASRANIGKALKANRIRASYRYARRRSPPSLFRLENGQYVYAKLESGEYVYEKLKSRRTTREEFKQGFEVKFDIAVPLTPEIRAQIEAERDVELDAAKTDAERKRIERAYNKRLSDTSYTDTYTEEFQYDFTDAEWDAYVAELDSMAETSLELLRSQLERFSEEQDTTYTRIQRAMNAPLTEGDRKLIDRLVEKFTDITVGSAEYDDRGVRKQSSLNTRRAEAFIIAVNKALLAPEGEVRPLENLFSPDAEGAGDTPFFDAGERAEVEAAIQDFRTRYKPEKPKAGGQENPARFVVQQEVRSLANERIVMKDAEAKAAHDIETSYVPFFREGGWQVRMAFIGADGREYAMTDRYRDQTAYFQFDSRAEAEGAVPGLTELFDPDGETTYEMEVFDPNANNGLGGNVIMKGKLVPQTSAVITTATTDPELNFNESMRFLRRFNLHPDPARAEQIILALTSQNDRAIMRQLRAAFVAGSENDLTQAISQHIESRASTIARNRTNVRLANALDLSNGESRKLWYGDRDEYNRRKAAWEAAQADPNMGPDAKHMARVAFDEYHSWFKTHDSAKRGGSYYNEARKLVTFLDQQKQVLETDMASNPVVTRLQMLTAMAALMASIASGSINVVGLFTNVPSALATYNAHNAYGGGFGWDGFVEVFRALTTVGMSLKPGGKFDTAKYWSELSDAELKKKGMTREEANFLADGIAGGFLDAAQFNSLTGSSRGRVTSGAAQKFVEWAMLPFNTTEQTSRRAAALAAFRLEFNRRVNAGANRVDAANAAGRFAESIVASTLGGYTTGDRPAFFRGGIQQFAFMFKQFVVNSATLLANLDRKGKIVMLGSLLLLAGLRGIPFAEDIEDIVDSLAAKFGIPVPSIREYMIAKGNDFGESIGLSGFGNLLMSGTFNQFVGTDFGARTGLGNIVPGTEMFLPGAEMSRVLEEIGGPMVSFAQSALTTMGNVLDFAPGGRPGDLETLIREQPISILRAWGDAYAYQRSGAVVDRRGYLVSDEYNAGVSLMRVLGFYPLGPSREYDIVRIGKRRTEYLRSYTTAFRDAIVRAEARGDRAEAARLYEQVREWNRWARGTGLEIEGIREKVQRALKAQRQLASERFIQSTARSVRPYIEAYEGMYTN